MTAPRLALFVATLALQSPAIAGEGWERKELLQDFHAEGSAVGDLNGDGAVDIAYGPFWFAGPDFTKPQRFAEGEAFQPKKGYSDNFFSYIRDYNGDDKNDILVFGFPGKEARLYLNPGKDGLWPVHLVADKVANESPHFIDLIPGGLPEIVCSRETEYGYYEAGEDPTQPWTWHSISEKSLTHDRFGHALGVGDVNGDGRLDILEKQLWFEQPEAGGEWKTHRWATISYGGGGAQILVDDVDNDGDADLITSLNAHGYGIAWFEQFKPGMFSRHDIIGKSSTENPHGVAFSQPHALSLVDMDGDGRNDFVTGKRWMAHQGKDPGGLQEPVLYWFQNTKSGDEIEFVPHLVDNDSGVGTDVTVADLNADGLPDIVTGSKKGLIIHRQKADAGAAAERWRTPGGRPQDNYGSGLSPEEALARMEVPEGFSVDLIAAEPTITQPIAMCFDSRGRIWVVEGHTYPQRAPEGEGKDRIVILEDKDADGTFETKKTFAEGINLASGIEVGFGGVYVGAAPYFLFYPDKDGDDVPDGEPEVLLDGWGYQDTHETLNAFTWGPDGWLYGCHGVFTHSNVGKPGTPDEERQRINAGIWRYHPTRHEFEVYAHGTSNPWGVDFNQQGDFFISACVIPHFFHMVQGGRYIRQAGQHFNPFTFGEIDTIADHDHYSGKYSDVRGKEFAPAGTSALGGGHAHCGLAFYFAEEFPVSYRGDIFFNNLHGHRIVREHLEHDGSGYTARHRPDFVLSNNHENIGVTVMLGPDGAMYYSDWVDPQTCHHRNVEIWNRTNGRIYRVRHGDIKSTSINLASKSDDELVKTLSHSNSFLARQAQRLLQERAANGSIHPEKLSSALDKVGSLNSYWTAHSCGLLNESQLLARLTDEDEYVRAWTLQFLAESKKSLSADALAAVEKLATSETSLITRRYLASMLQRIPLDQRWKIAQGLIGHSQSQFDRNIPHLTWYGIEPLVEAEPDRALSLITKTSWSKIKDFITRRAAIAPEGRSAIMSLLTKSKKPDNFINQANLLQTALSNLQPVEQPNGWEEAKAHGKSFGKNPSLNLALAKLGARFGDAEYFPKWRAVALDPKQPLPKRVEAIGLLIAGNDPEIGGLARKAIETPGLRSIAIQALRKDPGTETANTLVSRIGSFPLKLRNEAINLLATRPEMALPLLKAVDEDKIEASLVSPVMLDQFERFNHPEISSIIEKNWVRGGGGIDIAQLTGKITEWKKKLNSKVIGRASASRGRQTFNMTCGTCHQLFGEGIALGPDLTGSNRSDLGYILENALAPSSVVGKDYMLNIFTMKDGSVVSGMIREETPEFIKVAMPGGSTADVEIAKIAERQETPQSLMPPGLFEALPLPQVADLVKYLASPNQVPLPGEQPAIQKSDVPPPAKGVMRIEGESLTQKFPPPSGQSRPQNLRGHGPYWSGNAHLWWTGGKPGDVYTLKLEGIEPGTKDLTLFPTTAKDYATIKVAINGQLQEADLYTEKVLSGEPIHFKKINVSPTEPLQIDIHITGKNEAAIPAYMVGIDRIEIGDSAK